MAALANGMALHGGVIPVCATFFVFSDYMKPAVRLSALMELPVKFVWSHDAFRVGEDGPTHQPVEQEAQIRLLEKMDNLAGHPQPARAPPGRQRGDRRRVEDGAREPVDADRVDLLAPEHRRRARARDLALRRCVRRHPRRLRRGGRRRHARRGAGRQRVRGVHARGGAAGAGLRGRAERANRVGDLRRAVRGAAARTTASRSCRSAFRPSA